MLEAIVRRVDVLNTADEDLVDAVEDFVVEVGRVPLAGPPHFPVGEVVPCVGAKGAMWTSLVWP